MTAPQPAFDRAHGDQRLGDRLARAGCADDQRVTSASARRRETARPAAASRPSASCSQLIRAAHDTPARRPRERRASQRRAARRCEAPREAQPRSAPAPYPGGAVGTRPTAAVSKCERLGGEPPSGGRRQHRRPPAIVAQAPVEPPADAPAGSSARAAGRRARRGRFTEQPARNFQGARRGVPSFGRRGRWGLPSFLSVARALLAESLRPPGGPDAWRQLRAAPRPPRRRVRPSPGAS